MINPLARTSTALAALILGAPAAFADVSPKEVWAHWTQQMKVNDMTVSATETMQGNDLKIDDLKMMVDVADVDDTATVEITMPGLTLIDNGDGTVDVKTPASYPMTIAFEAEGEKGSAVININTAGLKTTASGEAGAIQYDSTAASLEIALDQVMHDGAALDLGTLKATLINVTSTSMNMGTIVLKTDQQMTAETLLLDIDTKDPTAETDDTVKLSAKLQGLELGGSSATPADADFDDFGAALKAGFAFDFAFKYQGGDIEYDMLIDGDKLSGTQSYGAGAMGMAMNADMMQLTANSSDGQATIKMADLPFPVSYATANSAFELMVPLSQREEEQDFKLAMTLGGFTMADALWGLFDPAGQLPRDPATISFDISGKATVLSDLFDETAMETDAAPGEVNALSLNNLTVSMVGAELKGTGAFTFDNSDLSTFDGMPRPEGAINLSLKGANKLMDTAVSMGLLGQEDVMGARMMMGMFAVPGEGEDSLTSKIEVNSQGHVLANGMRLQ